MLCHKGKKIVRRNSPHDTIHRKSLFGFLSYQPYAPNCGTVRTERSTSFAHVLYHALDHLSIGFWKIFFIFDAFLSISKSPVDCRKLSSRLVFPGNKKSFRPSLRHNYDRFSAFRSTSTKKATKYGEFFYCVDFLPNFFTKNRLFWTIYKSDFLGYNNNAVGGTNSTASCTTHTVFAKYQAYDIGRQETASVVLLVFFRCFVILRGPSRAAFYYLMNKFKIIAKNRSIFLQVMI